MWRRHYCLSNSAREACADPYRFHYSRPKLKSIIRVLPVLHVTGRGFVRQRLRYLLVILLALGVVGGRRLLFPQIVTPLAPINAPASQSFLVILGGGDKVDTNWDGSITATD